MIYLNQLKKLEPALAKKILKLSRTTAKILKIEKKSISITICNDRLIQKLNKQYRHKDRPTDVLSFCNDDPVVLGDIIISLPTAQQNRRLFGTSLLEELMFLIVHGCCHLLGHDHHTKTAEAKMQKLEKKVLNKLFGKNYHA